MTLGPQFEQLKMFMSANEISPVGSVDSPVSIDLTRSRSERLTSFGHLLSRKEAESRTDHHRGGLHDSIMSEGVKAPVQVIHSDQGSVLGHGNHRFATMAAHKPDDLMPVMHTEGDPTGKARGDKKAVEVWDSLNNYSEAMDLVAEGLGVGDSLNYPVEVPKLDLNNRSRRS